MLGRKPQVGKAGRGLIEAFWRFGDATSRVCAQRYDVKRITRVRYSKLVAKAVPSREILRNNGINNTKIDQKKNVH